MSLVQVRLTAPPDGILITGQEAGPGGSNFDLVAEFKRRGTAFQCGRRR